MSDRSRPSGLISRREFLRAAASSCAGLAALPLVGQAGRAHASSQGGVTPGKAPAILVPDRARPQLPFGVASGDVTSRSALIWSRADRPSRMWLEVATNEAFRDARRMPGPAALEDNDFTARIDLQDLPPGERIFYRVSFQDLADPKYFSEPVVGRLRTAPVDRRTVRFAWSADTAGQGFGINEELGGMRCYETIRRVDPDFFIHSGDTIYADNPIPAEIRLDDTSIWRNLTTPEKSKVAETLDEFRGAFRYNLLDANVRRFNAEVPVFAQWDDHETVNNWYPGRMLEDARYTVRSCDLLAARARRAFFDYMPVRRHPVDPERIFRSIPYGPLLDIFFLDCRTWRGPNTANRQTTAGPETAFLGAAQVAWLKEALTASKAVWKVIACDMPLGLIVPDGQTAYEAVANGEEGAPLGRELEIAGLLRYIRDAGIRNLIWITADVHYAAAHYYDPGRARFTEFHPFWEFVAGPLNAATFGPNKLDPTFGPQLKFLSIPPNLRPLRPPNEGMQYFGTVEIDGRSEVMKVRLHNLLGDTLYTVELPPEREKVEAPAPKGRR